MKNIIYSTAIIIFTILNGVTANVDGAEIDGILFQKIYEVDEVKSRIQDTGLLKYLGFIKGKATKRYSVNAEGAIQEKAPWYRFLYAESE